MTFTLAIVGRPNVGKSTLYNRLTGQRALVDNTAGTTRDIREGQGHLGPMQFKLLDTAGLENARAGSLQARMTAKAQEAIDRADAVLMVVDGRTGITPMDIHFATAIRKKRKPVVLVVNKTESKKALATIGEAYTLGLGNPIAISAAHGEGLIDLHDAIAAIRNQKPETGNQEIPKEETSQSPLTIAIAGRPNAGKSTLFNRILGSERTLTGPEAGITRDAIAVDAVFEGHTLRLVDTAGMRRKFNVAEGLEKLSVSDAIHAIRYAHVVVLVLDANSPLDRQDNIIASLTEQEGRALVIAVNKWDTLSAADKPVYLKAIQQRLSHVLPQVSGVPVVTISAEKGENIGELIRACQKSYAIWNSELGTGELNRWLAAALEKHTPPLVKKTRIKIRYMTQKSNRPPTFILFANRSDIPDSYLRYLTNDMREHFDMPGIPIRLKIRRGKNPYAKEK